MRIFCPILIFLVTACSSLPVDQGLDRVQTGMDKDSVLELAGNPEHTFHENSQDHWIFEYYHDGQQMSRHIVFKNGHVISIAPSRLKSAKAAEAAGPADDMEQYEKAVHDAQKKHESQFKEIPGQ